jgi:predicted sugar kinase
MSEFFFKLGGTAWLLAIGVSALALVTQWLSVYELADYAWRQLWLFLGGGGVASFVIGGVCAIWE